MSDITLPSWKTYDQWRYITSTTSKSGSDSISGLSRSTRCFQKMPPGVELYNENYYAGTPTVTPGPGSYEPTVSLNLSVYKKDAVPSFGVTTSTRMLTSSDRMWAPRDKITVPGPGAYNISKSSTEDHIKATLGVTKWSLRLLKEKSKTKDSLPIEEKRVIEREIQENYKPLLQKKKYLEEALKSIQDHNHSHRSRLSPVKKPAFTSTERRWHQMDDKIQESPTFYRSAAQWDFGTEARATSPQMSTFNYAEKLEQDTNDEFSKIEVMEGVERPRSRCRETDFFGVETISRIRSPAVGSYTPPILQTKPRYLDTNLKPMTTGSSFSSSRARSTGTATGKGRGTSSTISSTGTLHLTNSSMR